jgi:hypothetical protein
MATEYRVEIDRITLHGVAPGRVSGAELRAAIAREVAARLERTALPAGRTAALGLRLEAAPLSLASADGVRHVARAVAEGVSRAVTGHGGARA